MAVTKEALATVAPPATPDFQAIKTKQQATWASGDYAVIGVRLQIVGESLAEAADIRAGEQVLDVAAGNGNATLAAARRFAQVTSTDYVPELLDKSATRAAADGLDNVTFRVADAEALLFDDDTFDVVLSSFGVMFTPNHQRSSAEMLRVVKSGGRIGMANWTPEGFIGQLFKIIGKHVPPPAGVQSPALWGTEPYMVQLFGGKASDIRCVRKTYNFRYRSAGHWMEIFRDYYGPTLKAFAALDANDQKKLEAEIVALLERLNIDGRHSLVVPGEYLEVVIVKH